ncbi:hypothetical protein EVAR_48156_1 [Eumeta japonica]|uniref:Uncharacterized protein n=1 Tax=Eumeta variegata TaxID=151549 RepID=A0A4C1WTL5_EUMVA|nr:hypothetical protein EVAR_48156_1 [Eumeta japonica]
MTHLVIVPITSKRERNSREIRPLQKGKDISRSKSVSARCENNNSENKSQIGSDSLNTTVEQRLHKNRSKGKLDALKQLQELLLKEIQTIAALAQTNYEISICDYSENEEHTRTNKHTPYPNARGNASVTTVKTQTIDGCSSTCHDLNRAAVATKINLLKHCNGFRALSTEQRWDVVVACLSSAHHRSACRTRLRSERLQNITPQITSGDSLAYERG